MNLSALAYAIGAIALWSTNAFVAKHALAELSVEQVQVLQFTSAAVVFVILKQRNLEPEPSRRPLSFKALLLGVIGLTGTMVFQYLAFAYAPITQANIIAYGWPLLVAMWVALSCWRPAQSLFLIVPALVGFVGVSLVIGDGRGLMFQGEDMLGYVFAFISALCMAIYTVGIARTDVPSASLLLPATLFGVALTVVWCAYEANPWPDDLSYILMGLYLGAGPMGCGYFFWSRAVRKDSAGRIAVLGYLTPVCSTSLLVFSGESLSIAALTGAVLVFSSCLVLGLQKRSLTHG